MKMKTIVAGALALFCCATFAQEHERGGRSFGGPRRGMHMREGGMHMGEGGMMSAGSPLLRYLSNPDAAEKLGLSEEQKTKLKALDKGRSASYDAQDKVRAAGLAAKKDVAPPSWRSPTSRRRSTPRKCTTHSRTMKSAKYY